MAGVRGYRLFNVTLARKSSVSPSLLSLVFHGPDVAQMKCDAPDQRIKMLFPSEDGTPSALPLQGLWYSLIQTLPKAKRPVMRTYTLRHVDGKQKEMTVEFVSHGTEGPASAWAIAAQPGEPLQIIAPDAQYPEDSGGYEWTPPQGLQSALIIADETALPAARGIIESLAAQKNPPRVQAFFEVPEAGDCVDLSAFPFARINWLPRKPLNATHGERLIAAVQQEVRIPQTSGNIVTIKEEAEGEPLWDRATTDGRQFYGWVAGESSVVKMLRRHLTGECGMSHEAISFMAYWSKGRLP